MSKWKLPPTSHNTETSIHLSYSDTWWIPFSSIQSSNFHQQMSVICYRAATWVLIGRFGDGRSFSFSLSAAASLSCKTPMPTSSSFMPASEEISCQSRKSISSPEDGSRKINLLSCLCCNINGDEWDVIGIKHTSYWTCLWAVKLSAGTRSTVCTCTVYIYMQSAPTLVFATHTSTVVFITKIPISWQFLIHIEPYAKELINKGCYGVQKLPWHLN